jgi:hypothetical protein
MCCFVVETWYVLFCCGNLGCVVLFLKIFFSCIAGTYGYILDV